MLDRAAQLLGRLSTKARGDAAEARARRFLQARGLKHVASNYRIKGGEIDLIMREGEEIVFVEVRARSHRGYGGAAASISAGKQQRILLAAQHWLQQQRTPQPACRFDCVLIDGPEAELTWLRAAFGA
ncbi:MAG TPA: YraN family protein [Burkholderiaceae bacterium]|nr:YraN family protein [Burkholderiaceae bacterium]